MRTQTVLDHHQHRRERYEGGRPPPGASSASAAPEATREPIDPLLLSSLAQPSAYPKEASAAIFWLLRAGSP